MSDVTRILSQIESGEEIAAEQLLPLVCDELRKLAVAKLAREQPRQTLQATAPMHRTVLLLSPQFVIPSDPVLASDEAVNQNPGPPEEIAVAETIVLSVEGFDFVVGPFERPDGDGVVVPGEDAVAWARSRCKLPGMFRGRSPPGS